MDQNLESGKIKANDDYIEELYSEFSNEENNKDLENKFLLYLDESFLINVSNKNSDEEN